MYLRSYLAKISHFTEVLISFKIMWLAQVWICFLILPSTFCAISCRSLQFSKLHFMICQIRGWWWTLWSLVISPCAVQYVSRSNMSELKPRTDLMVPSLLFITRVLHLNVCTCNPEIGWLIPVLGEHWSDLRCLRIHRVWEEKGQRCKNPCTSKSNFLTLWWERTSD